MFEKRKAKKAAKQYEEQLARWQQERDASEALLTLTQTYSGEPLDDLILKKGGSHLIEDVSLRRL